ncbi:Pneumococcal surface protein [Streptococcus pneumoniae]|uniref:Choline binding protein n=1 Tax=Streptococcus pneumoniae TaxID=1313 RepID=A0ABF7PH51_STREE|nr:choline binding protein [Streptococcus pneumoniae]CEW49883.1 choline binding protein [Streptococcus pneumoniae]CEW96767.1 choline binding protein [Streptococcus pneumoniae]CIZ81116.1 choline binding protein [Streptococcus pneumoniae]CJA09275.1 choline binding protein [Streptococcus pneumoniae]
MNKRLFLKMSLVTLPILALFSQPVLAEENIHFSSCKEAWANGYSDIHEGEPGYSAKLDRDHDGVACELKNAPKGAFKAKQSTAIQINTSSATTSGWVKQDGAWYYFDGNGNLVKNAWQGSYYLKADGKMAKGEWVDGGRYYVGADGVWKEGQASTASSSNDSNSEYSAALGKAKSYNSLFHMSKKTYV